MANYNKKISETAIRVGEVRFGYVNVFSPKQNDDGVSKYSVQLLIPKTDSVAKQMIEEYLRRMAPSG